MSEAHISLHRWSLLLIVSALAWAPSVAGAQSWSFASAYGVGNFDDDDRNGQQDWVQAPFSSDDDLSVLVLPQTELATMPVGDLVGITIGGHTDRVAIYHDGRQVLGGNSGTQYVFEPGEFDEQLPLEFGSLNTNVQLRVWHIDPDYNVIRSSDVELKSAPMIINHHLQPAEQVYAVYVNAQGYSNRSFIASYQRHLGSNFTYVNGPDYGWDVWIQDEIEFATLTGNGGQRMDVVIDSIRNRGLAPFAQEHLVGPGTVRGAWGSGSPTTFDSFGNLEASPPVTVDSNDYPFGRIYWGRRGQYGPVKELRDALEGQVVQDPFEIDTAWLCVGHVDEISTFVPDPSSPKGFKFLFADVTKGYALLESMSPSTRLPLYDQDYGYATVGELLGDRALRAYNEDIQFDYLDFIRETFKRELDLTEDDIIDVPIVFEQVSRCGAAALIPGMINLIVANVDGERTHVFVPDPAVRQNLSDQSADPFIQAFDANMPSGLDVHYVDIWDVYHVNLGETHCGTNVRRTPIANWWTQTGDQQ